MATEVEHRADTFPFILALAQKTREQLRSLKGKKRDEATIAMWAGAYQALSITGAADEAHHVGTILWILSIRGYAEIEHLCTNK